MFIYSVIYDEEFVFVCFVVGCGWKRGWWWAGICVCFGWVLFCYIIRYQFEISVFIFKKNKITSASEINRIIIYTFIIYINYKYKILKSDILKYIFRCRHFLTFIWFFKVLFCCVIKRKDFFLILKCMILYICTCIIAKIQRQRESTQHTREYR